MQGCKARPAGLRVEARPPSALSCPSSGRVHAQPGTQQAALPAGQLGRLLSGCSQLEGMAGLALGANIYWYPWGLHVGPATKSFARALPIFVRGPPFDRDLPNACGLTRGLAKYYGNRAADACRHVM